VARMRSLCVEGWRFISHSYAMVNQWQLLSLLKRADIRLYVRDAAYFYQDWQPINGLFSAEQEASLAALPELRPDEYCDATLRISAPLDFSPCPVGKTIVFGTSERQFIEDEMLKAPLDVRLLAGSDFAIVTPSQWSSKGFLALGFRPDQIKIVPHGVDTDLFRYPTAEERQAARKKFGARQFTFANASAMTGNKGIDKLLRAFAVVAAKYPDTLLLLKGADDLYRSKQAVQKLIADLPARSQQRIVDRLLYFGETVSIETMAQFYHAADAYVAPYRAEGFNLPVLEACASGTPVICTKGGPTDDFMKEDFTLFVNSDLRPFSKLHYHGYVIEPDLDHLIHSMLRMREDAAWRNNAGVLGARHAAQFSWDTVTDKLVNTIFADNS